MSNSSTQVKRGRGRPRAFPGVETRMAGFNLPDATLQRLAAGAKTRGITQNALVDRAINAYLRRK